MAASRLKGARASNTGAAGWGAGSHARATTGAMSATARFAARGRRLGPFLTRLGWAARRQRSQVHQRRPTTRQRLTA
eukprot:11187891-Lingulodinium_polyedra.AAC.1